MNPNVQRPPHRVLKGRFWPPTPALSPITEDFQHRRAATTDALALSTLATQVFFDTYATQGINDALAREVATVYAAEVFERRLRDADVELLLVTSGGYAVGFVDIVFASRCLVPDVCGAEVLLKRRRGP